MAGIGRYSVVLERQLAWLKLVEQPVFMESPHGGPAQRVDVLMLRQLIRSASPFYISPDCALLTTEAALSLGDAVLTDHDLPAHEAGFACLEGWKPNLSLGTLAWATVADTDELPGPDHRDAAGREAKMGPTGVLLVTLGDPSQQHAEIRMCDWKFGESISAMIARNRTDDWPESALAWAAETARCWLSLTTFMQQRICVRRQEAVDRPARRRMERAGWQYTPQIEVVTLRARDYVGHHDDGYTLETEPPDWSCRWIVRAHWRQQFYPSENRHKRILIGAYVKGPEDRPLKTAGKLFAVVR